MVRAIGIDLGTTYTVVATLEGGRPRVIPNAEGQPLTPSVVAFTGRGEPLVGEPARRQAADNPEGTIFSIKRRMGSDGTVRVGGREYTPQEVSGFILRKARDYAEERLGGKVNQAVVTVPAYFNDRQRHATKEAAALAGLDVLRLLNEPTAAALAYGLDREGAHTVLVWDLGGGTFDVSVLELGQGIFEVRAVSGDSRLGGDDFDSRVMDRMVAVYKRVTGADFPADAGARQGLREAAEKAKRHLSFSRVARVHVPMLGSPRSRGLVVDLTRTQLEDLTQDLLQRMVPPTRQALHDARLSPEEIDRVILVGGATRMPAVRDLVRRVTGKEPYRHIDPDQVVATGAAIYAGMLLGLVEKAVLLDVLPLSLGVETQGGLVARLIPRNTPLPASGSRLFTTAADGQTSMDIHVLQGERELAVDNVSLGQFQLKDIPPAPRGVAKVEVAFQADVDGIVHVSASDLLAEREVTVQVASTKLLDPGEIQRLTEEAQRHAGRDGQERERIWAGIEADNTIAAAEMVLSELAGHTLDGTEGPQADPWVQRVLQASARVKEALAGSATADIKARTGELRRLLAALPPSLARSRSAGGL